MENKHFDMMGGVWPQVKPEKMNPAMMWAMINLVYERGMADIVKTRHFIREEILRLSPEDAVEFNRAFEYVLGQSYNWEMADAASLIIGAVGENPEGEMRFLNFRVALMLLGEHHYYEALKSPEFIADLPYLKNFWLDNRYWVTVVSSVMQVAGGYELFDRPRTRCGETWGDRANERFPLLVDLYS